MKRPSHETERGHGDAVGSDGARRAYRLLLRVLPHGFRAPHGADMEELFLESLDGAASRSGAARVWAAAIADVLLRAPIEHWRARKTRPDRVTDLRHAMRRLGRSPVFTIVSLITLAVGIGANTAIFTVVDSILLKPLPFEEPERLVGVWHTRGDTNNDVPMPPQLYFTYREQGRTFEDIGLWDDESVSVTGTGEPEQVGAMKVTDGIFPLLRVQPVLGRVFTKEDDTPGSPLTTLLSHGYWQRRFGGDPRVVGSTITVNGHPREVIGVLPQRFRFLDRDPSLFLPFRFDRSRLTLDFSFRGIARLRAGATIEQANADIERMIPIGAETFPAGGITIDMLREAGFGPNVRPLRVDVVGDIGGILWVLLGTVGIVLLIAVANVANLFLVRAEGRQQELAVRTALGADRWRIARDLLAESLMLGLLGGATGLLLATAGLRILVAMRPPRLPRLDEIAIGPEALSFTLLISLLAGVGFGVFPVLKYRRANMVAGLKESGRGGSAGREQHRVRNVLVITQVALAFVLLVGAGLMIRSAQTMRRVDPGFERPAEILAVWTDIPAAQIADDDAAITAYERITANLRAIPGVRSVGMISSIPMSREYTDDPVHVEDFPSPEGQIPPIRRFKFIGPGYFETMENRILAGRSITWSDIHTRAPVVVVTENFAREYWKEPRSALGRRVREDVAVTAAKRGSRARSPWREIVGVVADTRDEGMSRPAPAIVYWPMIMNDFMAETRFMERSMAFAIRSQRVGSPTLLDDVKRAIWSVNENLALSHVHTLAELRDQSMARTSFALVMLGIAAAVALLLGTVGIYGVISYVVSQRTREIGVRMALGASAPDVSRLVLRHALALAGTGVVIGLLAAAALTQLMSALLFGVSALDPVTYGTVAAGLVAIALLASWLPVRRAMNVDPIEALRWE